MLFLPVTALHVPLRCAMAVNLFITPTVLLAFPDFVTSGSEHADVLVQEPCLSEFGSFWYAFPVASRHCCQKLVPLK